MRLPEHIKKHCRKSLLFNGNIISRNISLILVMVSNEKYRLDRNAFAIMSFEESDNYMRNYKHFSWQERLAVSLYLTGIAYNFDTNDPPRLDRNYFHAFNRQ
jgi:hypothetical protein